MLRCEICGGQAVPGLAHLHGDPTRPLCHTCTQEKLKEQRRQEIEILIRAKAGTSVEDILFRAA